MAPVAMTFLLWLAGHTFLWHLAQQAEGVSVVTIENDILLSKINVSLRDSKNSTIQWINNRTTHPNPGGNKEKLILKRVTKKRKSHQKGLQDASSNHCGEKCCPGWSMAPKTGTCTRAICTPKCKNRGVCRKPQECVCKVGFGGSHCERRMPPLTANPTPPGGVSSTTRPSASTRRDAAAIAGDLGFVTLSPIHFSSPPHTSLRPSMDTKDPASPVPTITALKSGDNQMVNYPAKNATSLNWQPLTVQELQSILQRKGFAKEDKMAALLAKHLETQKSQTTKESWKEKRRTPNSIRTARGEYNILRQTQTHGNELRLGALSSRKCPVSQLVTCIKDMCPHKHQSDSKLSTVAKTQELSKDVKDKIVEKKKVPALTK